MPGPAEVTEALDQAYREEWAKVLATLTRHVDGDLGLAEDAVQEAFLAVWRTAGSFVPERAKASTWILMLVHRRAVDAVRREARRPTDPLENAPEAMTDDSAAEDAWRSLERTRVREALAQLPDPQREAIELAFYAGFTQSELSERLGVPLGTIKSRVFTGLARLRDLLEDTIPEEERWSETPSTS
jgi:RNA polymerase sigma-70 factor (ECF subfamily)